MIGMNMANEDAFEVPQSLPGIQRSQTANAEIPNKLAPSAFPSIKQNIAIFWYLYEGA